MAADAAKRAPAGLGAAGRLLWKRVMEGVTRRGLKLNEVELPLLAHACAIQDTIATLAAVVKRDGPTSRGSTGQLVAHPCLQEIRAQQLALTRLLGALNIDLDAVVPTPAAARARKAAGVRWSEIPASLQQQRARSARRTEVA